VEAGASGSLATEKDSSATRVPSDVGRQSPATDLALLETARPPLTNSSADLQAAGKGAPRSAVPLRH